MQIGQTVKTAASYARRSGFDFHICNHIPFDGHVLLECVAFLILKSSDHTWFEDSFLPNYFFENQLMRNCHILSYVFCTFTVHSCYSKNGKRPQENGLHQPNRLSLIFPDKSCLSLIFICINLFCCPLYAPSVVYNNGSKECKNKGKS